MRVLTELEVLLNLIHTGLQPGAYRNAHKENRLNGLGILCIEDHRAKARCE